jgi:hypothetical protein
VEVAGAEHSGQQHRWEVERGPKRRGCDLVEAPRGLVVVILLLAIQEESATRERGTLAGVALSRRRERELPSSRLAHCRLYASNSFWPQPARKTKGSSGNAVNQRSLRMGAVHRPWGRPTQVFCVRLQPGTLIFLCNSGVCRDTHTAAVPRFPDDPRWRNR